jgi:hypothetical protein
MAQIPIKTAPTIRQLNDWQRLNSRLREVENIVYGCRFYRETIAERRNYLNSYGIYLASNPDMKLSVIEKEFGLLHDAITRANSGEYGARWRDNDFDIVLPDAPLGAVFIPVLIGSVVIAGCIALLNKLGKEADETASAYRALKKEADSIICKDPESDMCKNWNIVKEAKQIDVKESFADRLLNVGKTAVNIGLAVVIGVVALSVWRFLK